MEYSGVEKPLEQEEGIKSEIIETQSDVFKRERLLKTSFEWVDFTKMKSSPLRQIEIQLFKSKS